MVIALHIALLVQAPEKSGWLPYLRMLPKKFDTMPVRYPQELFDLLPQNAQGICHDGTLEWNQWELTMMSQIAYIGYRCPSLAHVKKQKAKIVADYNCVLDFLKVPPFTALIMLLLKCDRRRMLNVFVFQSS